ncbi:MAG: hypothetical protein GC131_06740 [Alphaproteobacteria bacterium]|nr:hypothetical protein [Alphaproteobacteria bacterium]
MENTGHRAPLPQGASVRRIGAGDRGLLRGIAGIAKRWVLPDDFDSLPPDEAAKLAARGFLVSGYTEEKYAAWAAMEGGIFAVVADDEVLCFLAAYGAHDGITPDDAGSDYIRQACNPRAVIVKQVGTHPGHCRKGYPGHLYDSLMRRAQADIFLAIVEKPLNAGSEGFHAAQGYAKIATFLHPDGRPRGIWKKPYDGTGTAP